MLFGHEGDKGTVELQYRLKAQVRLVVGRKDRRFLARAGWGRVGHEHNASPMDEPGAVIGPQRPPRCPRGGQVKAVLPVGARGAVQANCRCG